MCSPRGKLVLSYSRIYLLNLCLNNIFFSPTKSRPIMVMFGSLYLDSRSHLCFWHRLSLLWWTAASECQRGRGRGTKKARVRKWFLMREGGRASRAATPINRIKMTAKGRKERPCSKQTSSAISTNMEHADLNLTNLHGNPSAQLKPPVVLVLTVPAADRPLL